MRSASVFFTVILHASLLQKSSATTLYVHEHFNEEISPCTDFNKHVCNLPSAHNPFFKQTHANVLFEEAYENTLKSIADPIYDEIAKIISAKEALVIDHCRKDYTYNPKASDAHAQGMAFGKRIAFGTAKDCSIHCHERKYCMLRLPDDRVFQKEPFSQAPPFIQGVFKGFFRLIDPKFKTKDLEVEYSITANSKFSASDVGEFEAFKKIDTSKDFRKSLLKVLFSSDRFAAYFNYLYSLRLLQAEVFPESEVVKELDTLYQLILTETIATVSNSYTVETRNREDLVGHLRKIENVIGVPEIYRNIEVLKRKVEYFQEQFALFKHVFEKSDCKLQLASGWLYLFHLQELLKENRLSTENVKTESVFQWNLFYDPGHDHPAIRMLPAFIHIAKQEMSIGMKYGILASSIGHEIFHALGLGEDYHLIRVQQNEYYKDNKKCYEDYYGSFRVNIDGKMKYPNGELKAEEGFCDIEGSRVAVRVLKKVLESRNLSRESRSISGRVKYPTFDSVPLQLLIDNKKLIDPYAMNLTEIQWFYVFSALIHCSNLADDAAFKNYRGDEHPRPTQRANALVGQLREFTKAFQCRPDDRLFVTPRRCEMFPQKIEGKPKPKISAWKTNPSMAATVDARKRKKSAKKTWSISVFLSFVVWFVCFG
ncbi:hypothetical protein L596_008994 [Steinernema carpocapsae]|uniref:Peptidase M13 C-terminal domain-containing protein n=1 Tax=Steinernema carpocapsae TaxID=34508 RepID=A0A4U5PE49_STECR|nr:hypothetical protein L596_008994 [Steinernema carpocapsae]